MKVAHIYELLREHSRVIIPNFGAFLLKERPRSDISKGPGLMITFNDFLKFNDGLLIDHVALREKIDKAEADAQIKEFISKIQYDLINTGEFILDEMGRLYKDEKGNLKFEQNTTDSPVAKKPEVLPDPIVPRVESSSGKTGLAPLKNSDKKSTSRASQAAATHVPSPPPPPPPKSRTLSGSSKERQKKEVIPPPPPKIEPVKTKTKLLPIWRYVLMAVLFLIVLLLVGYFTGLFDKSDDQGSDKIVMPPTEKSMNEEKDASSYLNNEGEKSETETDKSNEKAAQEKSNPIVEDDIPEDEITVQNDKDNNQEENIAGTADNEAKYAESGPSNVSEQTPKSTSVESDASSIDNSVAQNAMSSSGSYHVISASFEDKGMALKHVMKLKRKGFNSRIINEKNGYYRVAYNSYTSKSVALDEVYRIRASENNPNAWYLYHRMR